MIVMLDTPQDLDECARELGGLEVEQLFTPLTRRAPQRPDQHFGIDNGAFAKFDPQPFRNLLARHNDRRELCRFVALPDVVGSARRTREVFGYWAKHLNGWRKAYVVQDGQEDIEIPWDWCDAIFVGGSTEWKLSRHAAACVKAAKAMEKWVHIGRVNTGGRYEYFRDLGADSCDGTGLARYSHMRAAVENELNNPRLLLQETTP